MSFRIFKHVPEPGVVRFDNGTTAPATLYCIGRSGSTILRGGLNSSGSNIGKSVDGGVTWSPKTTGFAQQVNFILPLGGGVWLCATNSGGTYTIFLSSDDGESWGGVSTAAINCNCIATNGAGVQVAVFSGGAIQRSTNNTSWSTVQAAVGGDIYSVVWSGTHFVAAGFRGGVAAVYRSTDGSSWTLSSLTPTSPLRSIVAYSASTWVGVGDGGIVARTTNSGSSWSYPTSGSAVGLRIFKSANNALSAIGQTGVSIVSTDGGANWTSGPSVGVVTFLRFAYPDPEDTMLSWAVGDSGVMLYGHYGARVKSYANDAARLANTPNGQSATFTYIDQLPAGENEVNLTVASL